MKKITALLLAVLLCLTLAAVPAAASADPAAGIPTPTEGTADAASEESPELPPEEPADAVKNPGDTAGEPADLPERPDDTAEDGGLLVIPPASERAAEAEPAPVTDGASLQGITLSGVSHQSDARSMLSLINSFRTSGEAWYWNSDNSTKTVPNNLKPLAYDYALEQIAMQRAAEIAVSFSHTRPDGTRCFTCTYNGVSSNGENIAMGTAGWYDTGDIFLLWREDNEDYNGQGHRRNMLDSDFTAVGIACFEYDGEVWWVQEFGCDVSSTPYTAPADGPASFTVNVWRDDPVPTTPAPVTPAPATPSPVAPPAGSIELSAANFPDEIFRDVVAWYADENKDGWLSPAERDELDALDCSGYGITSLQGIGYFPNLEGLECSYNHLTSLDLSGNPKLLLLWCEGNELESLDLSPCPELEDLDCSVNILTTLNVSSCPKLGWLDCSLNALTALDVSGCKNLSWLDCSYNDLISLKLGANDALLWLYAEGNSLPVLDISGCPEMVWLTGSTGAERQGEDGSIVVYRRVDPADGESYWGLSFSEGTTLVTSSARSEMDAVRILQGLVGLPGGVTGTAAEAADILRSLG